MPDPIASPRGPRPSRAVHGAPRPPNRRARIGALALLLFPVAAIGGLLLSHALKTGPDEVVEQFIGDLEAGRDQEAADRTDDPGAAASGLGENRRGLDDADVFGEVLGTEEDGNSATVRARLTWQVPGFGAWSYDTRIALRERDGWEIRWRPAVVHPKLQAGERLGTVRARGRRAGILARDGSKLVEPRDVVRVGAIAGAVEDPVATAQALADALEVDAAPLERQIRNGGPRQFVEALTLRREDYLNRSAQIDVIPDVEVVDDVAPLAPSREFARALLGTVAPITAEQLKRLGPGYGVGDDTGQTGLQGRFEKQLAGTPSYRIVVRTRGVPTETLARRRGRRGRPLRTTLDLKAQTAAEVALTDVSEKAALVAIQPSSGDILAVANRPVDSSYDRALEGQYPPGSTFKVISTAALLRDGLDVEEIVPCPETINVGGRSFRNFEGGAAGDVPFSEDFEESCNTAFVGLARRLAPDALQRAARTFGLGARFELPLAAAGGSVPPGADAVERAAAMIGQAKIVASPLAMAGVAGTVAAGRWRSPRLVRGDPRRAGEPLDGTEAETLRTLMRAVVTEGTGTALAAVADAAGKSGTAEYGSGDPPPTHAWFIAFRGDLAISVLFEDGVSGGEVAAPVAASFFDALDSGEGLPDPNATAETGAVIIPTTPP